jgi:plastocyanin
MTARTLGWLALAALCPAASADAGVIRGVLRPPVMAAPASMPMPGYPGTLHALPAPDPVVNDRASDAVISVERVPAAVESTLAPETGHPQLAQKNQAFVPRVLPVAAGTTVDFPNLDPIFHNVFSVSPGKRFDLGKYPRGHSRSVRFDRTGLIQVYCDIHSNMAAFILVLPNRAFVQPDDAGHYQLPELPAGDYVVDVWHPDLPSLKRTVHVPEHGAVDLDLAWGPGSGARPEMAESPDHGEGP